MTNEIDDAGLQPATGDQYELRRGDAYAKIGQVAAVLREFSVGGVPYTETWPDAETPPMACGTVLAPWPNRVAGGRWVHDGSAQQLALTEPARGNAIHGLLRYRPYRVVRRSEDGVTLGADIYPQAGWPFTLETTVCYTLVATGLQVTHAVRNRGQSEAVFGCGAHPYLRIGDVPVGELVVTVRAEQQIATDRAMIPVETRRIDGGLAGLPTGMRVGDLDLDTGFTGLQLLPARGVGPSTARDAAPGTAASSTAAVGPAHDDFRIAARDSLAAPGPGHNTDLGPAPDQQAAPDPENGVMPGGSVRYEHTLTAPDGRGLTLWAEPAFAWVQVFTPRAFPAVGGPRQAVAIEPMTCPADALNSGEGLIRLAPGESWQGSWGLTPR